MVDATADVRFSADLLSCLGPTNVLALCTWRVCLLLGRGQVRRDAHLSIPYRSTPGRSLKSDGTNVCGSAGSVRSACWRGVRGTSGGGSTRARDHAMWQTQYL